MKTKIDQRISFETVKGTLWWETCVDDNGEHVGPIGTYPDERSARQGHERWVKRFPTTPPRRRPPLRLLLAEDNPEDVQPIQLAFERASGWDMTLVTDGAKALDSLQDEHVPTPDLCILNLNMPKLTGYELLEMMESDPKLNRVPVIMWSVSRCENSLIFSDEHGAFSYVAKYNSAQDVATWDFIRRYWDGTILERV